MKKRAHAGAMSAWLLLGGSALAVEKVPIERLMASTVCVVGEVPGGSFESSGFVVGAGNTVMTTAHEIGAATNLRIKLRDGRVFRARLERLGNKNADIALLGLTGLKLPPVKFGTVQDLHTGDAVLTIGCPLGFDFSVTSGVVSSIRASDLGYPLIQTDVPVNPGSSGGPLFDSRGRVVGIIKSAAAGRDRIHFALPADLGSALVEQVAHERDAYETFNRAVVESVPENKLRLYRSAVELDPSLLEAHYNLALTLEKLGQLSAAEAEYRQTLQLRPGYSPAALNLGALLYGARRYREAIDVYLGALPHDPRSEALRNNLAEAYRASGDRDGARREFEALLRQNPDYAPAHYGLAVLYDDDHGDRRRAADHYRRYLALAPQAADADQVRQWLRQAERAGKAE